MRFLIKYFQTRTLTPFAIYCVVFGLGSIIYLIGEVSASRPRSGTGAPADAGSPRRRN